MAVQKEKTNTRFKLIHLEIALLIIENLAVWRLLINHRFIFPGGTSTMGALLAMGTLTTFCTLLRFLYLWLIPDDIEYQVDWVEDYASLFFERLLVFIHIYCSSPEYFWYIIVGIYAMSTICSVASACKKEGKRERERELILRR
ncbi:uncharacterized protein LOC121050464 [Rosa chinensis]|uniref:uncharacterized protein LOC121050464 n=1 Tax=Rosa chinensis TaxID=74649 RepID=UPI001AD8C3A2|nr:uncharacterized protein LOC121050464 [Rosa chinensis]